MQRDLQKYERARLLRIKGESIRSISQKLRISSSTSSIWCRDIELSDLHKKRLSQKGIQADLLRSYGKKRHEEKVKRQEELFTQSKQDIKKLTKNELFVTGLALYWAEGFKSLKEKTIGFCNSDPRMIIFILHWLQQSLNISKKELTLRAEFNIEHLDRFETIEKYWSDLTGIPRSQFTKPYLQKARMMKEYKSRESYHGVLRIRVRKSSLLLMKMRGWIEGLSIAT